jgi:hypothetical protein
METGQPWQLETALRSNPFLHRRSDGVTGSDFHESGELRRLEWDLS